MERFRAWCSVILGGKREKLNVYEVNEWSHVELAQWDCLVNSIVFLLVILNGLSVCTYLEDM